MLAACVYPCCEAFGGCPVCVVYDVYAAVEEGFGGEGGLLDEVVFDFVLEGIDVCALLFGFCFVDEEAVVEFGIVLCYGLSDCFNVFTIGLYSLCEVLKFTFMYFSDS